MNTLAEAIAGEACQLRPQRSPELFTPTTTITLSFDGKNKKFKLFEDIFQGMLKMQPETTEALKIRHFGYIFAKKHYKISQNFPKFTKQNSSNKRTLEHVLIIFQWKLKTTIASRSETHMA